LFSISANISLDFKTLHKMWGESWWVGFLWVCLINGIMNDYGYVGFGCFGFVVFF